MNIGREDSLDEQISALQEKVSRRKDSWTASSSQVEYDQQRLKKLQKKTPEGFAGCKRAGRAELSGATETP